MKGLKMLSAFWHVTYYPSGDRIYNLPRHSFYSLHSHSVKKKLRAIFDAGYFFLSASSKGRPCSNSPRLAQCIQMLLEEPGKTGNFFLPLSHKRAFSFQGDTIRSPALYKNRKILYNNMLNREIWHQKYRVWPLNQFICHIYDLGAQNLIFAPFKKMDYEALTNG